MEPPNQPASHAARPVRNGKGASVLGPRNLAREAQVRELVRPPAMDKGSLPNLRWSFAGSHNRMEPGSRAGEITVRELPVSTATTGIAMRLDAGTVREMHWCKKAERSLDEQGAKSLVR